MDKSIAHNVLITNRRSQETGVHVIIWPRKKTEGAKQFTDFNVAVCELSGWIPIYGKRYYLYDCPLELHRQVPLYRLVLEKQ